MGQISFNEWSRATSERENNNNNNGVSFFSLQNDGDEAIVRIMHDDTASFRMYDVHDRMKIDGKFKNVSCLRAPTDPVDTCPLCSANKQRKSKIYINMIRYFTDENGKIIAKPVVWERADSYANKLKGLIDEYGPLSESIFKIKRNGAKGSLETTYDIYYCNPKVYTDAIYPMVDTPFNTWSALGTMIVTKSYEELASLVASELTASTPSVESQYVPKSTDATVDTSYKYVDDKSDKLPWEATPVSNVPPRGIVSDTPTHWPNAETTSTPPTVGRPSARYY